MGDIVQGVGQVSGAYAESQALKAEKYGERAAITGIETAAKAREADRKEALARALASQNALAGAMGVTLQGTPTDVMVEDIRAEKTATERDRLMTDIEKRKRAYMMKAKGQMGKMSSLMGYLEGGTKIAEGSVELAAKAAKGG